MRQLCVILVSYNGLQGSLRSAVSLLLSEVLLDAEYRIGAVGGRRNDLAEILGADVTCGEDAGYLRLAVLACDEIARLIARDAVRPAEVVRLRSDRYENGIGRPVGEFAGLDVTKKH